MIETISLPEPGELLINYTNDHSEHAWNIKPEGLLENDAISGEYPDYLNFATQKLNFQNETFDLFSAIFYHLSRHEEYQTQERDGHDRFSYKHSCIYQSGHLEFPFIDHWVDQLKLHIKGKNPNYKDPDQFKVIPTMDIDSVFTYKGKGVQRQIGALIKDLLHLNFYEIGKRTSVLLGWTQDPNDNFELQKKILGHLKMTYFVQVSDHGEYDKNVPIQNKDFKKILKSLLNEKHRIGVHPGYNTYLSLDDLELEILRLSNALESSLIASRQHFLRFSLPKTYRNLIACNIKEDHSMGYSERPGFRAGTAFPFKWFDLEKNSSTELTIVPFSVMDVSFKQFLKQSPSECIQHTEKIKNSLKSLNAPFVFVFHNESLSNHRGWENWHLVFKNWLHE